MLAHTRPQRRDAIVASAVSRFRYHAGIVADFGRHESQCIVGENVNVIDQTPWRDVIGLGDGNGYIFRTSLAFKV